MKKIRFVVLVITLVFLAQLLFFYRGVYFPPPVREPDFLTISVNSSEPVAFDDTFTKGTGTVLIDLSHGNAITPDDLNLLLSRILVRGYRIEFFRDGDLKKSLSGSSSFLVISPASPFSTEDVKSVKEFVEGGGRLLMLSEPMRENESNSLAAGFGILFWNDYLYNLKENDGNFRNIFLTEFRESNITHGLQRIVFFTSSSVFGNGIIFTDSDTYSSSTGEKRKYPVAVTAEDSRVLAIGNVAFLIEPFNVLDNKRLISNIADFLAPPSQPEKPAEGIPAEANASNASSVVNVTG